MKTSIHVFIRMPLHGAKGLKFRFRNTSALDPKPYVTTQPQDSEVSPLKPRRLRGLLFPAPHALTGVGYVPIMLGAKKDRNNQDLCVRAQNSSSGAVVWEA